MKYYKLTLIKDLPEANAGYSKVFSEDSLKDKCGYVGWTKIDYDLRYYQNNTEFVKKEIDLSKALPEIICPHCKSESLFSFIGEEISKYNCDVTQWYKPVGLECGLCGYKLVVSQVCTKTKVNW